MFPITGPAQAQLFWAFDHVAAAGYVVVKIKCQSSKCRGVDGFLKVDQVNAIRLGYYLRAVIMRNAALHALGQPLDLALTASTISLLSKHGEPEFSTYDKAANAILLLMQNDQAALPLLEELNEIGYRSVFFVAPHHDTSYCPLT